MIEIAHANDLDKEAYAAAEFYNKAVGRGTFNHEHFKRFWAGIISHGNGFILKRTNDDEGEIKEAIGVLLYFDPFTGVKAAHVAFWMAGDPAGLEGGHLYRQLIKELKQLQVARLLVSAPTRNGFESTSRFLEKCGFVEVERTYDLWQLQEPQ